MKWTDLAYLEADLQETIAEDDIGLTNNTQGS